MENLNQEEWREASTAEDAVIIDVRTAEEWEEGIVEGARLLDIFRADEFMAAIEEMDPAKKYYMYCRSGNRSGQACMIMKSKGIDKVFNLEGGMLAWTGELTTP